MNLFTLDVLMTDSYSKLASIQRLVFLTLWHVEVLFDLHFRFGVISYCHTSSYVLHVAVLQVNVTTSVKERFFQVIREDCLTFHSSFLLGDRDTNIPWMEAPAWLLSLPLSVVCPRIIKRWCNQKRCLLQGVWALVEMFWVNILPERWLGSIALLWNHLYFVGTIACLRVLEFLRL